MKKSTAIILTGMHRSGTSLTGALLEKAGVFMGIEMQYPEVDKTKKPIEHADIYRFHKTALDALGLNPNGWCLSCVNHLTGNYQSKILEVIQGNTRKVWGWKDPCTSLFLQVWDKYLPEAKYIFVFRPPWEVVDSLFRSGDEFIINNPEKAIELWIFYNKTILNFYQKNKSRCILTAINKIITSSQEFLEEVNRKFSINLNTSVSPTHDKNLFNKAKDKACLIASLSPEAINLYIQLVKESWSFSRYDLDFEKDISDKIFKKWLLKNWRDMNIAEESLLKAQKHLLKEQKSQLLLVAELERLKKQHGHSLHDFDEQNKTIEKLKKENQHLQYLVNTYRKEARSNNQVKSISRSKQYKD